MLCLFLTILVGVGCSFLYSLINSNAWLWFIWLPLGLLTGFVLFFVFLYAVMLPILGCLKPTSKFKYFYAVHVVKMVNILCGAIMKVEGKENLAPTDKMLIVSNHKSKLDPCLIYAAVNKSCSVAAKSTLWKVSILKPLIKTFEILKIDRDNDRETAKSILQGIKYLKNNQPVIIFPEGGIKTRETEQMVALKPGAYKLATKSDAVIQPIVIIGSSKLHHHKPFRFHKVIVRILPALYPSDYQNLNTHEIGYKVIEEINSNFKDEKPHEIQVEI